MKCPNCGAEISSSDKRCRKCGEEIKNSSSKLIIGIIIAIVVIAIVGIFASGIFSQDHSNNVVVVNTTNSQDDNTSVEDSSNNQTDDSSNNNGGKEYWASKNSDKFHSPDCKWAKKIKESNKIVFTSREDAIASGRVPCSVCNP